MRNKRAMCIEPLASHHLSKALLLLRHISSMISLCIKNYISVCLLKATVNLVSTCQFYALLFEAVDLHQNVHHLKLPLYHQTRVREQSRSRMPLLKHRIWIFWYVNGSE